MTHYIVDLVLISVVLAGVHRNTGLVFDTSRLSSVDFRTWFGKYLAVGEFCYDRLVSLLRISGYFKQRSLLADRFAKLAKAFVKEQTGRNPDEM